MIWRCNGGLLDVEGGEDDVEGWRVSSQNYSGSSRIIGFTVTLEGIMGHMYEIFIFFSKPQGHRVFPSHLHPLSKSNHLPFTSESRDQDSTMAIYWESLALSAATLRTEGRDWILSFQAAKRGKSFLTSMSAANQPISWFQVVQARSA